MPVARAVGAVLAHSVPLPGGRLRKGMVLDADAARRLADGGHDEVTVARLEAGDVPEDAAAARLAHALRGPGLTVRDAFTGRANLHADGPGLLRVASAAIAAANGVDPAITVATLPPWQRMAAGTMAATVKIIPYAVPEAALARACDAARGALARQAPTLSRATLIVTTLGQGGGKTAPVTDRLARLGLACETVEVPHAVPDLAAALRRATAPLRLVLTASATSDARDVGPAALGAAGGTVTRVGMPVDPGNLLFLGEMPGATVIGLPGCARSPALNGADWVLERIACGVDVTSEDIAAMGVGGLLGEIPTRPQPREK